ncbi:hypothetical protein PMIT1313_01623 [Prochlorococcus marinus str. MIT 1313]|uniref:hypothetical protein n=1 Tax=Prochlorococcus marinus TaxID=1219 RepID=UPI0007B3E3BC|nr:hypothetical protein [Prochlorococcus marinus]KZR69163.1 hypothetical protein PMIT1313_01623 [Prochlorococcus marinus str. MIT 1313]
MRAGFDRSHLLEFRAGSIEDLIGKGETEKALKLLKQRLRYTEDSEDYRRLGLCLLSTECIDEAVKAIKTSLKIKASYASYRLLGYAYYNKNEVKNSLDAYEKSQEHLSKVDDGLYFRNGFDNLNKEYRRSIYEKGWSTRTAEIQKLINTGETNLSRVIRYWRDISEDQSSSEFDSIHYLGRDALVGKLSSYSMSLATNAYKENSLYTFCAKHPNADWILELGGGCGQNLCKIWLNNGPIRATYISAEFTESGRIGCKLLASLTNEMRLISMPFDYYQTDVAEIIPREGYGIVFTNYSVEQIPLLRKDFITELASIRNLIEVMHLEPICWQLEDLNLYKSMLNPISFEVYMERCKLENHYRNFNLNLGSLLKEAEEKGAIAIDRTNSVQISHASSHYNPGCKVIWSPNRFKS